MMASKAWFRPLLILTMVLMANSAIAATGPRVLVFAAASMKNVLEVIGAGYSKTCNCQVVFSFAASGTLARQIDAGAPADIFISADRQWMDWLARRNPTQVKSRKIIAANSLVVAVPNDKDVWTTPTPALLATLGRIAMADPQSVPAGRYARKALETFDLWKAVVPKSVYCENVRICLAMAARGDVDAAITYLSDIHIEPRVKVALAFAPDSHDQILYPAAVVSTNSLALQFFTYLSSPDARDIFRQFQFIDVNND